MEITIVTALYDIRSKEKESVVDGPRKINDYIELGYSMLDMDMPIVIFTDNMDVYKEAMRYRVEKNMNEKTLVVWLPFEDTLYYKDLDVLKQRMEEYEIHNRNPAKDTPLYVLINNNKFDFLERAMNQNPFGSEFFFWIDYGIQHCAKASPSDWALVSKEWPPLILDNRTQIHQLRIHAVKKDLSQTWKDYFHTIFHHIGGSCFGGYVDCVREYSNLFKRQWDIMLHEEGWYQLDEAVMTIITEEYPDKFRFWHGDYDGLITNFVVSKRSWHLCFNIIQHHLDRRDYHQSEEVLKTLDPIMKDVKCTDASFMKYMSLRITNDFYRFGGDFSPALESILMSERVYEMDSSFLNAQIGNLRYYHRGRAMSFLMSWSFMDATNAVAIKEWCLFNQDKNALWIPFGNRCLSALAMDHYKKREMSFPLDYVECEPRQLLLLFRQQFINFYIPRDTYTNDYGIFFEHHQKNSHAENHEKFERRIRRLYQYLQTPSVPIVFFHTTEFFLMKRYTEQEQLAYDRDLVELADYIRRNFPDLTFTILALITNRSFTASHKNIIPIRLFTPFPYSNTMSKDIPVAQLFPYRESVYEWYHRMSIM